MNQYGDSTKKSFQKKEITKTGYSTRWENQSYDDCCNFNEKNSDSIEINENQLE